MSVNCCKNGFSLFFAKNILSYFQLFFFMPSCPFAGLPLVSPDVCPPPTVSQSGRSLLPCPSQQPQGPPALLPTPQQHPMGNHMIAQVCASSVRIYVMTYLYIIRHAFISRETLMLMVSRKLVLSWLSKIEK